MLQVIQYQKTGKITVEDLPAPQLKSGGVIVRNEFSLISAGTERTSVETAQANMIGKVRLRPDLVRQVMDNYRREGLLATYQKVQNRLDNYKDLGYSSAGVVVESACPEFAPGDRVACGGVGYAAHAELIYVPRNLVARVPDDVGTDEAAFTTVAAIAMQGVRQAEVHVGERIVVVGLGLLGLLTVQILKASGCSVFGLDISPRNMELARKLGCDQVGISGLEALSPVESFSRGMGADAVLITAASKSNEPMELATHLARKKGKIVVIGAIGMDIPRSPAYEKELDIRMSCSYGPGRYDPAYEMHGNDYPAAYVRWTENRNMESILDLVAQKKLDLRALVTHTFPVERALEAYDLITDKTGQPYLGVLISYPVTEPDLARRLQLKADAVSVATPSVGVIGAGNHTQSYLLPHLQKAGVPLRAVSTSRPVSAKSAGQKFGFTVCTTDAAQVLADPQVNLVLIGTRHDTHARYVVDSLRAGKHVFVEKPLALDQDQLNRILAAYDEVAQTGHAPLLMVGYNRRFSDPIRTVHDFFAKRTEPLAATYRINAGFMPRTNWYQDPVQGGRVIGEIGHFIDTIQFLTDAVPTVVYASGVADRAARYGDDNVQISLTMSDGSSGQITYVANGASAMPKERIEVFGGGKSAILDDFRTVTLYDGRNTKRKSFSGDKGHGAEMKAMVDALAGSKMPIELNSLVATSRASFALIESLRSGQPVEC